jgi:hypothetical protein
MFRPAVDPTLMMVPVRRSIMVGSTAAVVFERLAQVW